MALLAAPAVTCGVDEAKLSCDDALDHVADCCGPAFQLDYGLCADPTTSCGGADVQPSPPEAITNCIASLPCSEIVGRHYCERLSIQQSDVPSTCP